MRETLSRNQTREVLESKSANDLLSRSNINFYIKQSFEEPEKDYAKLKGITYSKNQLKPSDIKDINITELLGPSFKLAERNQKYKYMSRNERTRLMAQMVWSLDHKLPKTDVLRRKIRLHQILKEKQRRKTIREADPNKKVIQVGSDQERPIFTRQVTRVHKEEKPSKGEAQRKFRDKLFQGTSISKGQEQLIKNSFNSSLKYSASLYAKPLPKKLYHDTHSLGADRKVKIANTITSRLAEKHLSVMIEKEDPIRAEVMKQLNPMMKKHQQELSQIERFAPKNE